MKKSAETLTARQGTRHQKLRITSGIESDHKLRIGKGDSPVRDRADGENPGIRWKRKKKQSS